MEEGTLLVVHLIPTESARGDVSIDPVPFVQKSVPVLGRSGRGARINLDGALAAFENRERKCEGYSQLFRNGFFESVAVLTHRNDIGKIQIPSLWFEKEVAKLLDSYRAIIQVLGLDGELSVMLSILNADQAQLRVNQNLWDLMDDQQTFFDRKIIQIPDVTAESRVSAFQALKPAFDMVWQAAGFVGSANYDAAGVWRHQG